MDKSKQIPKRQNFHENISPVGEVEKIVALLKKNQQGTNNEEETNKN